MIFRLSNNQKKNLLIRAQPLRIVLPAPRNDGLKRLRELEINPAAIAELRSGPEALPVFGFSWMLF